MLNKHEVEIYFSGEGTFTDIILVINNMITQYDEFELTSCDFTCGSNERCSEVFDRTIVLKGILTGDIADLYRLTHHGEPLYENTNLKYVYITIDEK